MSKTLSSRAEMARDAWVDLDTESKLNGCPGSLHHIAVPKYIVELFRRRDEMVIDKIACLEFLTPANVRAFKKELK